MEKTNFQPLTRAWLKEHGWIPTEDMPLMADDPEYIDADLCVVMNRKEYMVAKFHFLGSKAWEPDAMPYCFELNGVNNNVELIDYDYARLVMSACVCGLTGTKQMDRAVGGRYRISIDGEDSSAEPTNTVEVNLR